MPNNHTLKDFEEAGYARCVSGWCAPGIIGDEIVKIERVIADNGSFPSSIKAEDNPYLLDPRDFEPATEEEYLKQRIMRELR